VKIVSLNVVVMLAPALMLAVRAGELLISMPMAAMVAM
jgi:hypothetical protein